MVLLLVACEAAHPPAPSRWIQATWFGPAIINNGPSVTLCANGTYQMTHVFEAPPHATGMSVDAHGRACCVQGELGRYELVRDPRTQEIASVHFMPAKGAPHDEPLIDGMLDSFARAPHAIDGYCR